MLHIIFGLFFIALGIWGLFDEWYYVIDFLKGGSTIFLIIGGTIAVLYSVVSPSPSNSRTDLRKPKRDVEVTQW